MSSSPSHRVRWIAQRLTPEVDQAKVREIIEDFNNERAGRPPKARPWEVRIKERQTYVRKAWLTAAKDRNQSRDPEDQELAKSITTFVRAMPPMKTERHELQEKVVERLQRSAQTRQGGKKDREQEHQDNGR